MTPNKSWLARVLRLKIKLWRYKPDIDPRQMLHIGPMADQWKDVMGLGDGATIDTVDAIGVLLRATQELSDRVEELEQQLSELRR